MTPDMETAIRVDATKARIRQDAGVEPVTLVQLRDELNALIGRNEAAGLTAWNDAPVFVMMERGDNSGRGRRAKNYFYAAQGAPSTVTVKDGVGVAISFRKGDAFDLHRYVSFGAESAVTAAREAEAEAALSEEADDAADEQLAIGEE